MSGSSEDVLDGEGAADDDVDATGDVEGDGFTVDGTAGYVFIDTALTLDGEGDDPKESADVEGGACDGSLISVKAMELVVGSSFACELEGDNAGAIGSAMDTVGVAVDGEPATPVGLKCSVNPNTLIRAIKPSPTPSAAMGSNCGRRAAVILLMIVLPTTGPAAETTNAYA